MTPAGRLGLCATERQVAPADLWAAEAGAVADASAERRSEFATGRDCARAALDQVGADRVALPLGAHGAPVWPGGFVGSISHTDGWTGAVAARAGHRSGIRGLGLDAEASTGLPDGVLDVVASLDEQGDLRRLGRQDPTTAWPVVLFTAKEAVYKAVHPLTGVVLAHDDVAVHIQADGRFTAVARTAASGGSTSRHRVRGRWVQAPRVVVSLAVVG